MRAASDADTGAAFMLFAGLLSLSIGVYHLAGAGAAWLFFGGAITALSVICIYVISRVR